MAIKVFRGLDAPKKSRKPPVPTARPQRVASRPRAANEHFEGAEELMRHRQNVRKAMGHK